MRWHIINEYTDVRDVYNLLSLVKDLDELFAEFYIIDFGKEAAAHLRLVLLEVQAHAGYARCRAFSRSHHARQNDIAHILILNLPAWVWYVNVSGLLLATGLISHNFSSFITLKCWKLK